METIALVRLFMPSTSYFASSSSFAPLEILSVTPDGKLQLWSMVNGDLDREKWPKPQLMKEVFLESKADVGRLGRAIAMTAGKVRQLTHSSCLTDMLLA